MIPERATKPLPFRPSGAHTLNSSLSSAVTLTPPDAIVNAVLIQPLTQNIMVTLGGTTPTASLGFRVAVGQEKMIEIVPGSSVVTVKVIEETSGAVLQYQWGIF
jgi:hypothetical protein